MNPRSHEGFTLIELLIVVVIIGILAAIAIPKYNRAREQAYISQVISDLKNLATQQEVYQANTQVYAGSLGLLNNFSASEGVFITINDATGTGWAATAYHAGLTARPCGVYMGGASPANGAPATAPGAVTCVP